MVAQVRQVFGVEMPLRRLFETPSVTGLGDAIDFARRAGTLTTQPPLIRVARRDALPLSYAQQRFVVLSISWSQAARPITCRADCDWKDT